MDNFNNPNDPYGADNQYNPYESNSQNDAYNPVPQEEPIPQDNQNYSSLDSTYNPQNDQFDPNQGSSTFNGYAQADSTSTYSYTAPPVNNSYIPNPQMNPQYMNNSYVPFNQQAPMPPMNYSDPDTDKKNANILCIISLICYFLPWVLSFIYTLVTMNTIDLDSYDYESYNSSGNIANALSGLSFLTFIAAWVLMIVARVKYPKSTFAKVLMWVYISLFILGIVLVVVIIVTCAATLRSMCPD